MYEVLKIIGRGTYGCVAAAKSRRTDKHVAIKKIQGALSSAAVASRLLREMIFLKQSRGHPNIIELYNILLKNRNEKEVIRGNKSFFRQSWKYHNLFLTYSFRREEGYALI
jgi:serine/threonine protein kinase